MAPHAHPVISYTPWRQFYQIYRFVSSLLCLPLWILLSSTSYTRLHPKWTFKQALMLYIAHEFTDIEGRVGVTETLTLDAGKDGDRFEIVDPFPSYFYQGPLSSSIVPARIGGVWFRNGPAQESKAGPFVLWVHGGAFVTGNGRSDTCGYLSNNLIQQAKVQSVFSLQYRLSGYGGRDPFPAAVQDIMTAYLYLTRTCEIPATSIVVAGNSSGGNLVIAFIRYLEQVKPDISRPLCAAVVSPWVTPLESLKTTYGRKSLKNHATEYVADSFHKWGARAYVPSGGVDLSTAAYITPLGHPFPTSVPIFVSFGECELLSPSIVAWVAEMRTFPDNQLQLHCDKYGVHASILNGEAIGWGESAREISSMIGKLVQASRSNVDATIGRQD